MVELMLVTRPEVFAAALRVLGDRARAEDTAQERTSMCGPRPERSTPTEGHLTLVGDSRGALTSDRPFALPTRRRRGGTTAYTASHFDRAHDGVWEAVWTNADNDLLTKARDRN